MGQGLKALRIPGKPAVLCHLNNMGLAVILAHKSAIRCNLDELPLSSKSALSQKLCKDQRQGLLCLIHTVEIEAHGPGHPNRRAVRLGP